jgi:hypothetical protein
MKDYYVGKKVQIRGKSRSWLDRGNLGTIGIVKRETEYNDPEFAKFQYMVEFSDRPGLWPFNSNEFTLI